MMKIFIFAYDRYTSMTTQKFFKEPIVLVHSHDHLAKFVDGGTITDQLTIITGNPRGLAKQRNFALNMMEDGEWALFINDDLINITELDVYDNMYDRVNIDISETSIWTRKFNYKIDEDRFSQRLAECMNKAEDEGINLVGFSYYDNPLFRSKKWVYNKLVDGRCFLIKKTALRFDEHVNAMEDWALTARNLQMFGKTLINQWILTKCKRWTPGGFGTKADRQEERMIEKDYLLETYPNYLEFDFLKNRMKLKK